MGFVESEEGAEDLEANEHIRLRKGQRIRHRTILVEYLCVPGELGSLLYLLRRSLISEVLYDKFHLEASARLGNGVTYDFLMM